MIDLKVQVLTPKSDQLFICSRWKLECFLVRRISVVTGQIVLAKDFYILFGINCIQDWSVRYKPQLDINHAVSSTEVNVLFFKTRVDHGEIFVLKVTKQCERNNTINNSLKWQKWYWKNDFVLICKFFFWKRLWWIISALQTSEVKAERCSSCAAQSLCLGFTVQNVPQLVLLPERKFKACVTLTKKIMSPIFWACRNSIC